MEIAKDIEIIDLGLFLKKHNVLIISDLHIGYENYLTDQGVFVPKFQYKDIINSLKSIFNKSKPEIVIINGDLKHEFGRILRQEWKDVINIIDFIQKHCKKIIIIKGNHDVILGPIARKKDIDLINYYLIEDILIAHGDEVLDIKSKIIIIGHDHPAVLLRDKAKFEKYKCFLKGMYKKQILIVQPSFNPLIEGSDVLKEKILSPYLNQDISNFELFIFDSKRRENLYFSRIKNMT